MEAVRIPAITTRDHLYQEIRSFFIDKQLARFAMLDALIIVMPTVELLWCLQKDERKKIQQSLSPDTQLPIDVT